MAGQLFVFRWLASPSGAAKSRVFSASICCRLCVFHPLSTQSALRRAIRSTFPGSGRALAAERKMRSRSTTIGRGKPWSYTRIRTGQIGPSAAHADSIGSILGYCSILPQLRRSRTSVRNLKISRNQERRLRQKSLYDFFFFFFFHALFFLLRVADAPFELSVNAGVQCFQLSISK
jgi:hypothetical protein